MIDRERHLLRKKRPYLRVVALSLNNASDGLHCIHRGGMANNAILAQIYMSATFPKYIIVCQVA